MGSTTCSDQALQSSNLHWGLGSRKRQSFILLRASFIQTAPAKTAMTSPTIFFSAINNNVPALFTLCCCSACNDCLPVPACSMCFSACFMCFSIQAPNAVDWLQWLTGNGLKEKFQNDILNKKCAFDQIKASFIWSNAHFLLWNCGANKQKQLAASTENCGKHLCKITNLHKQFI